MFTYFIYIQTIILNKITLLASLSEKKYRFQSDQKLHGGHGQKQEQSRRCRRSVREKYIKIFTT